MTRMILTDEQWALMEPYCLGKKSYQGRPAASRSPPGNTSITIDATQRRSTRRAQHFTGSCTTGITRASR